MKGPCILDASAVLALLQAESGHEAVLAHITKSRCFISAINLTEVLQRLVDRGMSTGDAEAAFDALELEVAIFDNSAARACAALRKDTRRLGLSIGDRACIALARHHKGTAVSADREWRKLELDVSIELIRPAT